MDAQASPEQNDQRFIDALEQSRHLVRLAWAAYRPDLPLAAIEDLSPHVSRNHVFRLQPSHGEAVIAKVSSFGDFKRFMEDHELILLWSRLMEHSRFHKLLAHPLTTADHIFSFQAQGRWVVFYRQLEKSQYLPKILSSEQIRAFAREMAAFHKECLQIKDKIPNPSYSVRSDIEDLLARVHTLKLTKSEVKLVTHHCHRFLEALKQFDYEQRDKIPLLIDWNIGNFSITSLDSHLSLESRWDYDWFRKEPRVFDFYFCSRVVSHVGDRSDFHYLPYTFNEPRFQLFLKYYDAVFPLSDEEIYFLKEVYRFFILNYVLHLGESFFNMSYFERLKKEALEIYLKQVDEVMPAIYFRRPPRQDAWKQPNLPDATHEPNRLADRYSPE